MRIKSALIAIGVLLLLCGCSDVVEETPLFRETENEIAIAASFSKEDGNALCGGTVRFTFGESCVELPLGEDGECVVSGLPRDGDLALTIFDQQERIQGAMTLSLSEGAVIDATTDSGGVGHITLRKDMDEVTLAFVLKKDGSLQCVLRLTRPDPPHLDLPQENSRYGLPFE